MKFAEVTKSLLLSVFLLCCFASIHYSQPIAFPGAEGYGSQTPGGRGGKVIQVTNLDDSGPGSLRDAIGQSGARIIVFRVSGTIEMRSDMVIRNSNITIAGQTAPGDGICLKNYKFVIAADDAIVRHLRIRRGNASGKADDALAIQDAENVIVDHCSISWGCDETLNTWHGSKNITIQWCIISEGLHHNGHGFAASLGGVNASYHHLLIANCPGRNPSIAGNNDYQTINMDFRNNVIFNFGYRTIDGKPTSVNIVNNYFKPGPNSTVRYFASIDDAGIYQKIPTTAWYVSGNVWESNERISNDNTYGVTGATQWLVNEPIECAPVHTDSAEAAYQKVLADVGATLPRRDPVDARIVNEARTGQTTFGSGVVLNPANAGSWPELLSGPAPADSDKDGMADSWEQANGLDPKNAEDRNNIGPDGYTMLEVYLHSLTEVVMDVKDEAPSIPQDYTLYQNYPNPFNPSTTISYRLPNESHISLKIVDFLGREVAVLVDGVRQAGLHKAEFDGSGLASGMYFARLQSSLYSKTIKVLLTK